MNPMYARNINTSRYSCFLKRLCNDVVKHHLNKPIGSGRPDQRLVGELIFEFLADEDPLFPAALSWLPVHDYVRLQIGSRRRDRFQVMAFR